MLLPLVVSSASASSSFCLPSPSLTLALTIHHYLPTCTLDLSKHKHSTCSAQRLNWCIPRYIHANTIWANLSPSIDMLGWLVFKRTQWVSCFLFRSMCSDDFRFVSSHYSLISNAVHICAYARHIHMVSQAIWLIWSSFCAFTR